SVTASRSLPDALPICSWTAGEAPGGGLAGGGPPAAGGRGLAVQRLASPAGGAAWAGGAWVDVASRRARWSTAARTSVRRGPKRRSEEHTAELQSRDSL